MRPAKYFKNFKSPENYPKLIQRFLLLCIAFLIPVQIHDGKRRFQKWFWFATCTLTYNGFVAICYTISKWENLNLSTKTENVAVVLGAIRFVINICYYGLFHKEFAELVHRMIEEKASQRLQGDMQITIKHCRQEFKASSLLIISAFGTATVATLSVFFFQVNEHNLPMNFRMTFWPVAGSFIEWPVNFIQQAITMYTATTSISAVFSIYFMIMNHSCWEIEQTIHLLNKIDKDKENQKEKIKLVVERSYVTLRWMKDAQRLLQFVFFFEFSIISLILCMNLYTILVGPEKVLSLAMILVQFPQLFALSWLGNRVVERIEEFTTAIYEVKWYELSISDRKSLQLILVMAQNMKPFNGVFKEVNMETFQSILQLAYSLLMFIKSVY